MATAGASYLSTGPSTIPDSEREVAAPWTKSAVGVGACSATYLVLFAILGAIGWVLTKPRSQGAAPRRQPARRNAGAYELRRVSIAFDWTARARIQQALDHIARTVPMHDDAGRRDALLRTAALLAESIGAARYAAHQSLRKEASSAERDFVAMTDGLRARYRHETRGQGNLDAAPDMKARADEGLGLVVVTLVVCGLGASPQLPGRVDRDALAAILRDIAPPSFRVVALEVVWSPAEENDRMSSAELEVHYPELMRVDSGGGIGRVQCTFCSGVFPAELGRCPGCGAPGPSAPAPQQPYVQR
ncbi:MAG: DUF1517 domain-containing protein [Deltaproteobacteria bacterium]|nr:DUF1517 domain-containing protein [Deltaproteobacteria bacterium]